MGANKSIGYHGKTSTGVIFAWINASSWAPRWQLPRSVDFAQLLALPAVSIRPTLEYDAKVHLLRGPLLHDVLAAAGAPAAGQLTLRAVDGYAAVLTLAQARAQRMIVATHMDGQPMALGGLGPLWAVYDADRVPEAAARPLAERFGACPWALYQIDVA